ncbi:ABC transporter permease [Enorma phocaeensis]|uniref:ABC transporter permease n=1 Tax=Enorma phocaeensis TaxID=1871019 RepID=UPI000C84306D|nr:ABC transporter permease [Enorma phocaeensis]
MALAMLGAVSQGILWGIMVLGVFITYKLLDIADLTVDGSFALGGCVCAVLVVGGMDPTLAIIMAMLAGMVAGAVTGFLHTVFEIPAILAGILTQIALWSVNLRIMGKSNTPLLRVDTLFSSVTDATGLPQNIASILVGLVFAVIIIVGLYWFFGTEIGSACRATGNNEAMVRALGVNTKVTKMIALTLSNGLVGLSGGLVCESQSYADIGMGTGAIVIGLAAIVIGEVLGRLVPGQLRAFGSRLTAAVVGSVVYFLIRAIVLQLGMDANDMKLISAVIVALALCVPVVWEKYQLRRSYSRASKALASAGATDPAEGSTSNDSTIEGGR